MQTQKDVSVCLIQNNNSWGAAMNSSQSAFSNFIRRLFAEKEPFNFNETEYKTNYQHLKKMRVSNPGIDEESIFEMHQPQHFNPKLIVISPQKKAQHFPLYPNSEVIIGRHTLSDIKINGFGISDFHAKLILSGDKVYIEDLHSKSGTFVNGRRSTPGLSGELADKTTVTIKNYQFHFDIPKPALPTLPEIIEEHSQTNAISDYTCSQLINENQKLAFWQSSFTELLVTAIINETPDTKTIRLASDRPLLFHYQPGQFVTLHLNINGQEVKRSYSIASSPSRPFGIEITVKKTPGGLVSNWLHNQLQVSDRLMVKGPMGRFSCFNYPAAKLLLIAAGSGVAPIMSMLRWLSDVCAKVDVQVVLSFRYPADIIYRRELKLLIYRHKNIHIQITLTGKNIGKKTGRDHWVASINRC
jgi:glycine betaine catabolism B